MSLMPEAHVAALLDHEKFSHYQIVKVRNGSQAPNTHDVYLFSHPKGKDTPPSYRVYRIRVRVRDAKSKPAGLEVNHIGKPKLQIHGQNGGPPTQQDITVFDHRGSPADFNQENGGGKPVRQPVARAVLQALEEHVAATRTDWRYIGISREPKKGRKTG